jgi:uncharacterized Rmd1/YagE family protein
MKNLILFFPLILFFSCKETPKKEVFPPITHFETRNYVKVGQLFDSIKPAYVIDVSNGNKRIVFIGCEHQMAANHPQFAAIETYFKALQPQITFNEGGQIADTIRYKTYQMGIEKNGESGALKYLSDNIGIKMRDGDMSDSLQFAYTSRYHTQEEWYLYYMIERIIVPYYYDKNKKESLDTVFSKTTKGYFTRKGFKMSEEQLSLNHFKTVYKKYMGKPFDINNFDMEAFDYVNDNCKFCAIGRTSKIVRDSVLLTKIDNALDTYDRVMVTFGHGHALAVEPALRQIINRKR